MGSFSAPSKDFSDGINADLLRFWPEFGCMEFLINFKILSRVDFTQVGAESIQANQNNF